MKCKKFFTYRNNIDFQRNYRLLLFAQQKDLMNRYIRLVYVLSKISKKLRWRRRQQRLRQRPTKTMRQRCTFSSLSLAVCVYAECALLSVLARYHQITLQFSLLVSTEFVVCLSANCNIILFILFTRMWPPVQNVHELFIRFVQLFNMYWRRCSGGTYTLNL